MPSVNASVRNVAVDLLRHATETADSDAKTRRRQEPDGMSTRAAVAEGERDIVPVAAGEEKQTRTFRHRAGRITVVILTSVKAGATVTDMANLPERGRRRRPLGAVGEVIVGRGTLGLLIPDAVEEGTVHGRRPNRGREVYPRRPDHGPGAGLRVATARSVGEEGLPRLRIILRLVHARRDPDPTPDLLTGLLDPARDLGRGMLPRENVLVLFLLLGSTRELVVITMMIGDMLIRGRGVEVVIGMIRGSADDDVIRKRWRPAGTPTGTPTIGAGPGTRRGKIRRERSGRALRPPIGITRDPRV